MRIDGIKIRVGDTVRIVKDCRQNVPIELLVQEEATYLGICWIRTGTRYKGSHDQLDHVAPKFRLQNGDIIWGWECWWEPMKEQNTAHTSFISGSISG